MTRFLRYVLPCLALFTLAASSHFSARQTTSQDVISMHAEAIQETVPAQVGVVTRDEALVELRSVVEPPKMTIAGKEISGSSAGNQLVGQTEADITFTGHVVAAGETLTEIAARYDTSVNAIKELNGLVDEHLLLIGQQLIIANGFSESGALARSLEQDEFVREVIGESAGGHPIESFRVGSGRFNAIVVGAMHGGYEWNAALLAYRLVTYSSVYPDLIPDDVTLHVIPIANPDGVAVITGQPGPFSVTDIVGDTTLGRPNGNGVDLNRNWGCDWLPQGQWGSESVSGGTRPISEPETRALRQYFVSTDPEVVIWLHSAAGLLVPGECNDIRHEASERAATLYGIQSGYPVGAFTAYRVTGDAADWLAQHKIASFTVELSNHQDLEFERNLAGLLSLLEGVETLGEE